MATENRDGVTPWRDAETWQALKERSEDGDAFEATYQDWRRHLDRMRHQIRL